MSDLDKHLKKHRKRIIDREEQTFRELLAAYDDIEKELKKEFRQLQKQILEAQKAGEEISPSWFYRKDRLKNLLRQTSDQVKRFGSEAAKIIEREQKAAIQIGVSDAKDSIQFEGAYSGKNLGASLNTKAVETAAGIMGDGSPLLAYFEEQLAPAVANAIKSEVIKAAAKGTDFNTIARRLLKAGDITRSRALSTARTEVNRVRRSAAIDTYRDNSDIVEGWIWVASKSPRTCPLCLAMDGTVMKLKEEFPQHVNCRCTLRAKLIGIEPRQRQTGTEYFENLPDEDKKAILGKTGFDAFQRGEVELKDFVAFKYDKRFGKSVTRKPLAQIISQKGALRGARGTFSGRTFDETKIGLPIRKLSAKNIKFTTRGVDVVEKHLRRFTSHLEKPEEIMLERLRRIASGKLKPSKVDRNFYAHELREFVRYRHLGYETGKGRDDVMWNNLHTAALEDFALKEIDDKGRRTLYTERASKFML